MTYTKRLTTSQILLPTLAPQIHHVFSSIAKEGGVAQTEIA
jgi:hypothetical protein